VLGLYRLFADLRLGDYHRTWTSLLGGVGSVYLHEDTEVAVRSSVYRMKLLIALAPAGTTVREEDLLFVTQLGRLQHCDVEITSDVQDWFFMRILWLGKARQWRYATHDGHEVAPCRKFTPWTARVFRFTWKKKEPQRSGNNNKKIARVGIRYYTPFSCVLP